MQRPFARTSLVAATGVLVFAGCGGTAPPPAATDAATPSTGAGAGPSGTPGSGASGRSDQPKPDSLAATPTPTPTATSTATAGRSAAVAGCREVEEAAADACGDYLGKAVPDRAGSSANLRNPDATAAQDAWQSFTNWHTGQARSALVNGVANWIGELAGKLTVTRSVRVTGGQGAASAGWAELRTVETWHVVARDGRSRRIEEKKTHTIRLLRFRDGWVVSRID
jgi:hypothetical protein